MVTVSFAITLGISSFLFGFLLRFLFSSKLDSSESIKGPDPVYTARIASLEAGLYKCWGVAKQKNDAETMQGVLDVIEVLIPYATLDISKGEICA